MSIFGNFPFLQTATEQIVKAKPTVYFTQDLCNVDVQALGKEVSKHQGLKCEPIAIRLSPNNEMKIYHIRSSKKTIPTPCIVYLHGLSSFLLEGIHLLPRIREEFSLCVYDSRGHGKDQKGKVTYGLEQSRDLYLIIKKLVQREERRIVLWGRSMGAVACIQMMKEYCTNPVIKNHILCAVLDSPFCSFQKIATEITAKNLLLPEFIAEAMVNKVVKNIEERYGWNFYALNFLDLKNISIPSIFMASTQDELISEEHTIKIMQNFGGTKIRLSSSHSHNEIRNLEVLDAIVKQIRKFIPKKRMMTHEYYIGNCWSQRRCSTPKKGLKITNQNTTPSKIKLMIHLGRQQSQTLLSARRERKQEQKENGTTLQISTPCEKLKKKKIRTYKEIMLEEQKKKLTNRAYH